MIYLSWQGIVELAREIQRDVAAKGAIDTKAAIRLARGILYFQNRLLGQPGRGLDATRDAFRQDAAPLDGELLEGELLEGELLDDGMSDDLGPAGGIVALVEPAATEAIDAPITDTSAAPDPPSSADVG